MPWGFWTLNPESAHQVTYLMGDRGIPKTFRHMNDYGSHTYMWINAAGTMTLNKNPDSFFAQVAQAAFSPGNTVPVNTYMFDGAMTFDHTGDQAVYAPSSAGRPFSDLTGPVEDS